MGLQGLEDVWLSQMLNKLWVLLLFAVLGLQHLKGADFPKWRVHMREEFALILCLLSPKGHRESMPPLKNMTSLPFT